MTQHDTPESHREPWWKGRLAWHGLDYTIPAVASRLPYFWGGITLTGIAIQFLTGFYLAQLYNPDPVSAHSSIVYIIERAWLGDFARSLHVWSANFVLAAVTLHLLWVLWRGSYQKPRELTYWAGVTMLLVLFGLYFTGTALKGDQESVEALAHAVAASEKAGPPGKLLTPDFTRSVPLMTRLYSLHVSVLPIALVAILGLHLWLIRFLGIHTHPDESTGGYTFPKHLRKLLGLSGLYVAFVSLLALVAPASLLSKGVPGFEVTKPPFVFLWIYTIENFMGVAGLLTVPPLVFLLLYLIPFFDRKGSPSPRDRKAVLIVGFGLVALLLLMAIYAKVTPAQQHLM